MTSSILSRLLTTDKPWLVRYDLTVQQYTDGVSGNEYPKTVNKKKKTARKPQEASVRFGRVPKREKAKILAAMQKNNASSQEKALNAAIEDDFKLMTTIIMAHEDTSEFTSEKVASFVEQARSHPVYSQCSPHGACPLNPAPHILDNDSLPGLESAKEFSKRFAPAIKGVVEFAKRIPGFQLLVTDDQVTLLKAGVFEVLLVRLAGMFDSQTNSLICLNGQVLRRDSLHHTSNARFLLDSMFDFAERMNALHLSDSEIALFCAVVILSPDRPGLRNGDLVSKMWQKITGFLQKSIAKSHPDNPGVFSELMKKIPDLRTLNTLHSEKLLAYKTEEPTIVNEMTVTGSIDVITSSSITNENSAYAAISHDIWGNYSLLTNQPPLIIHDEDMRCNSPPEVNSSSSSGSSGSDEWSTVDKEEQDLDGSPESVNGHCIDDVKSPPRTSSFSNHNGYANEESWVADSNQSVLAYQQHMMKRASESNVSPEHNSNSSDEGYYVDSPTKNLVYPKLHRVDSPTDSGIESGKEHGPSPPTIPNCSSPPSAVDEKMKDEQQRLSIQDKQDHIEDMPVLKRALQAPPLVNTNMLMDEAYRHHKKFRAARREAESPSSPTQMSLASTHSTLVRTLEQAPRYLSEQQLKRTDLIHNIIMQNETLPNHKSPPLPQHHQNSSQIPSQSHHVEALPTTCSSYSFSSVPNQTSPPTPPSNHTTSGVQQHKNLLLCANGYYVQQGGNVQSASIYSSSSTPALWPYSPQHTSPATTVSSATSPPLHVTQFEHPHIQQSSPVSFCSSPPVVNSSRAGSPRLSYHRSRSPATSTSTSLVMNGGVGLSPVHSTVCGSERAYHPEPSLKSFAESQPLNLSKKLFSPALVKIES